MQLHEAEQAGWEGIFGRERALEAMLEIRDQGLAQHIGFMCYSFSRGECFDAGDEFG